MSILSNSNSRFVNSVEDFWYSIATLLFLPLVGKLTCTPSSPTSDTLAPTTLAPTTLAFTTLAPTTLAPTTLAPTSSVPGQPPQPAWHPLAVLLPLPPWSGSLLLASSAREAAHHNGQCHSSFWCRNHKLSYILKKL